MTVQAYAHWIIRWSWPVLLACVLAALVAASSLRGVTFTADYQVFLGEDTLGLIVDDTVHILSKYNRARRENCLGTHNAIRFTFSHVGMALWVTTTILVAGFLILGFSSFKLNSEMGLLTAITLVAALVMDFLLLPPLLMLMDKEKQCDCVTCVRERALYPAE